MKIFDEVKCVGDIEAGRLFCKWDGQRGTIYYKIGENFVIDLTRFKIFRIVGDFANKEFYENTIPPWTTMEVVSEI